MATILDSLVGSCAKKLQDIITEEAILILGVKKDLQELRRTMNQIILFLSDAEQRSIEELAVKNWLGELKDAMYSADDIIDLARSEGAKLLAKHHSSSKWSAACSIKSIFTCIQKRHDVAVAIRNFNVELENISKLGKRFLKLQNTQPKEEVHAVKLNMQRGCLVEPNLVGRETLRACSTLVELVLKWKGKNAYKLGIVGTGGVGKTTLAQKIYNDQKIKGKFSNRAWICVSQKYSEVSLLQELLRYFGVNHEQSETTAELSSKLAAAIQDKSFFLVLDDVWNHEVWTNLLRTPLHAAATGVILLTTRHDTVARAIGVEDVHRVELMSAEVGWELLWKSMNLDEDDVQNLPHVGFEIVRKCGGLPLAIKVIASVLATKEKTENAWRKFTNKSSWSMGNLPTELSGALYLSYDDLPRHLKQCFLYCALYPEDYYMECEDLIGLWVAEGFVEEQEEQLLEDTAEEYYYELIYRNLLQPDPLRFDHNRSKMHDLLRQLAYHLSREESFCGDPQQMEATNLSKLHRVSVATKKDYVMLPGLDKEKMRARTLLIRCGKKQRVESTIFKIVPCIRVLDLTDSCIQSIPVSIGNLIHLRLLNLDGTDISCLPESIGSLMNLQILNLQRCKALYSLPLAITQLSNLRRLGLDDTPINQVLKGIGRLELLNDLEGFSIGGGGANAKTQDGWMLEELGHLSKLRRLDMIKLERAVPCNTDSLLADKKYLKDLSLCCTDKSYSEEDVCNIEKIFEQLIPPHNLEDLFIFRFFGRRYPTWLGTTHLSSVKYLILADCRCVRLPPIGQLPNLKFLKIDGATAVTKIGPGFLGYSEAVAFPKLESLLIWDLPNWEEWSFVEEEDAEIQKGKAVSPRLHVLPQLKTLQLIDCPKLRALPRQLGQVATNLKGVLIEGARSLKVVEDLPFLSKELIILGCDVLEKVSNLPQVRELRVTDCPNLKNVEGLGCLQQLWLDEDMQEISELWVHGLQQQHKNHGEDVDVYTWPREWGDSDE